jgi:hypothetical protein
VTARARAADHVTIRAYRPTDRAAVRCICADTGFLGRPIDPVFEDRELFADYLTNYYVRHEPDAVLVCEVNGKVMGYLLGCRRPLRNQLYQLGANLVVAARALYRCYRWPYNKASRAFLRWIVLRAWREVPAAPRRSPHFHLNLLAPARTVRGTRMLIQSFLEFLHAHGHPRVYGQMVTFGTRRHAKLFERYGFEVANRQEITKYRGLFPDRVFLSTIIRDLSDGPALTARAALPDAAARYTPKS